MTAENTEFKLGNFHSSLEGVPRMINLCSKQEQCNKTSECDIETVKYSLNDQIQGSSNICGDYPDITMLNGICSTELTPHAAWSALQHYIYFIYRRFVSIRPSNDSDSIPNVVSSVISEIFENLLEVDTTQVCIKLISLLRDYVLVVKGHIDNIQSSNVATYLLTLMAYYDALCSSASKCAPLLPQFDFLTFGRFNINWIGINKSIFCHHIYLSANVQASIQHFINIQEENISDFEGLLERFVCFTQDMQALTNKWTSLKAQITDASKMRAQTNPKQYLLQDWAMYSEHKKIFSSSGWLNRDSEVIQNQDMSELDAHMLAWVVDKSMISESLVDDKGCCVCKDCLAAEFSTKCTTTASAETAATFLISCYICHEAIVLDTLINHIIAQHANDKHIYQSLFQRQQDGTSLGPHILESNMQTEDLHLQLTSGTSEKNVLCAINKELDICCGSVESQKSIPEMVSERGGVLFPFNKNVLKDSKDVSKLASESQALPNTAEKCKISIDQMKLFENNTENGKISIKQKSVSGNKNSAKISSPVPTIKKANVFNTKDIKENSLVKKPQQKATCSNIDSKVLELFKTANAQKTASTPPLKTNDTCAGHACAHKCKQEEELKTTTCDHHKDFHKCDCAYCEVFGSAFPQNAPKASETKDRLRTRLNQRKEKGKDDIATINKNAVSNGRIISAPSTEPPRVPELYHPVPPPGSTKTVEVRKTTIIKDKSLVKGGSRIPTDCTTSSLHESTLDGCSGHRSPSSLSTCSLFSESVDCRDINELLNYIEGNKTVDKVSIAHKKAAKKARQRSKKAEEKERIELEEQRLKEEARLKEEERLKAEISAKKLAERQKAVAKSSKKKNGKQDSSKLIEETIPAMVTIKRSPEGNSSTLTITLQGSTPDTEKLLFTLVNGNEDNIKENTSVPNKAKQSTTNTESVKQKKKKQGKESTTVTKSVKVTLAVDESNIDKKKVSAKKSEPPAFHKQQKGNDTSNIKGQYSTKEEIPLPMLNLPPGITITKIDKPSPSTGNCKYSSSNNNNNPSQNTTNNAEKLQSGASKRERKAKKNQERKTSKMPECSKLPGSTTMVTLKNPFFEAFQNKKLSDKASFDLPSTRQASIFKGENGMVTIRSPRLQNPSETGAPVSSYFSNIQPTFSSDIGSSYVPMQQYSNLRENSGNSQFSQYNSHYHAREFLAGLPGIEITKINKAAAVTTDNKSKKTVQPHNAPTVLTNNVNGLDAFNFDADDNWSYESVFNPRESLEEGMDDEELELEEFKRFCQQSVPATHKEKVTNLNMKDIVFNKKDVSNA